MDKSADEMRKIAEEFCAGGSTNYDSASQYYCTAHICERLDTLIQLQRETNDQLDRLIELNRD